MKGKCLMAAAAMLVAGALGGNDAENKIMTPIDKKSLFGTPRSTSARIGRNHAVTGLE